MINAEIKFDFFTIKLPDESTSEFSIFEDLAEFFGKDYQSDAFELLKVQLKILALKPKPNLDYESDFTQIDSKNADTIFEVAKAIHALSVIAEKKELSKYELDVIHEQLKKWKRPPKQKWKIGDIFSIPLLDGTFSFGQIVGTDISPKSPILALFDIKQEGDYISQCELINARVLSVWNSDDEFIANHRYKILYNGQLFANSENVQDKNHSGGANIHDLANVFFGLEPYNVMYNECYYDAFLQPNIERPSGIIWLDKDGREKYRLEILKINENNQRVAPKIN